MQRSAMGETPYCICCFLKTDTTGTIDGRMICVVFALPRPQGCLPPRPPTLPISCSLRLRTTTGTEPLTGLRVPPPIYRKRAIQTLEEVHVVVSPPDNQHRTRVLGFVPYHRFPAFDSLTLLLLLGGCKRQRRQCPPPGPESA